jgi:4-amino-4-deoxy-L-arabinose transferase-like glycosyltransferase
MSREAPTSSLPCVHGGGRDPRQREGGGLPAVGIRLEPSALLLLLCLALYAPGLAAIPPIDRDEARFAQATRQMLETGDLVRIRFQDEARNKKPIGIYWLQAASVALLSTPHSTAIWPYRLPSAVAATLAALLTWAFGARLFPDRRAGIVAAVLIASSVSLVAEAHLAKTDAALLVAIVAAQGALGLVYIRGRAGLAVPRGLAYAFWVAEGLAILLKGPPGPLIAIATAATLAIADREMRWLKQLRPVGGIVLCGLIVAPWLVAVETATAGRFLGEAVGGDLLPKLIGGQEAHGAPPGYYLALVTAAFWPGSLVLVPALVWGWRQRRAPAERFLLAWLVPAWVVFELVPTKLPHYVLPLYPALALLAGSALAAGFGVSGRARYLDLGVRLLWALVTLGLAVSLVLLPIELGGGISAAALVAVLAVVAAAAAVLLLRPPRPLLLAALSVLWVWPMAGLVLPRLDPLWLSRSAAALVGHPDEPVLSVGYSEPSLVFLLGTATRLVGTAQAAAAGGGLALVADRDDAAFRAALGLRATPQGSVRGVDYSTGRWLVLTLYKLEPG